ncbi:hypothetical protein Tco_0200430 [Tanacetum coccineum]
MRELQFYVASRRTMESLADASVVSKIPTKGQVYRTNCRFEEEDISEDCHQNSLMGQYEFKSCRFVFSSEDIRSTICIVPSEDCHYEHKSLQHILQQRELTSETYARMVEIAEMITCDITLSSRGRQFVAAA